MDKHYSQLTLKERKEIEAGLDRGDPFRGIASLIGRQPSTVSREVRENRHVRAYKARRSGMPRQEPVQARRGLRRVRARGRMLRRVRRARLPGRVPRLRQPGRLRRARRGPLGLQRLPQEPLRLQPPQSLRLRLAFAQSGRCEALLRIERIVPLPGRNNYRERRRRPPDTQRKKERPNTSRILQASSLRTSCGRAISSAPSQSRLLTREP